MLEVDRNRADQLSDDFNCVVVCDEMRKRKVERKRERKSEVIRWATE